MTLLVEFGKTSHSAPDPSRRRGIAWSSSVVRQSGRGRLGHAAAGDEDGAMTSTMRFGPDDEEAFGRRREELVDELAAWMRDGGASDATISDCADDFHLLLDWRWNDGDGELDRWDEREVESFLLSWCPRKVTVPDDLARAMPSNVGTAMLFLAESGLLRRGSSSGVALDRHARSLQSRFMREMRSPANFGLAKSLFAGLEDLGLDDLDLDDPASLDEAMEMFNSLPDDERAAILDPAASRMITDAMPERLVRRPSAAALRTSALESGLIAVFDTMTEYFAPPGRPLTKGKAIKVADAEALAGLLSTCKQTARPGDERTVRSGSSWEPGGVHFWLGWAKASGALRHYAGRMVSVRKWRTRRLQDPGAVASAAAGILLVSGALATRYHRYSEVDELLDLSAVPLLMMLAEGTEPTVADIADRSASLLQQRGLEEMVPGYTDGAIELLVTTLDDVGLIDRRDEGDSVVATPLGTQAIIDLADQVDLPVAVAPQAGEQSAAGLADLAYDAADLTVWWEICTEWLDLHTDDADAIQRLLQALADRELYLLVSALSALPQSLNERLTPALESLARAVTGPEDEVGLCAVNWLVGENAHEAAPFDVQTAPFDEQTVRAAVAVVQGSCCDCGDQQVVLDSFAEMPAEDVRFLIEEVGHVLSPRAESLLEALGTGLPDKRLAKAARKELFRLRSRLAAAGR